MHNKANAHRRQKAPLVPRSAEEEVILQLEQRHRQRQKAMESHA